MVQLVTVLSGIFILGTGLWAGLLAFASFILPEPEKLISMGLAALSLWMIVISVGVFLRGNGARLGVLVTSALVLILGWCSNGALIFVYLSDKDMMFPDQILRTGVFFLLIPLFFLSFFGSQAVRVLFGSSPQGDGRLDYSMKKNSFLIGICLCVCPVLLSIGVSLSRRVELESWYGKQLPVSHGKFLGDRRTIAVKLS